MLEEEVPSEWQRYSNVIASDPSLSLSLSCFPPSLPLCHEVEGGGGREGRHSKIFRREE